MEQKIVSMDQDKFLDDENAEIARDIFEDFEFINDFQKLPWTPKEPEKIERLRGRHVALGTAVGKCLEPIFKYEDLNELSKESVKVLEDLGIKPPDFEEMYLLRMDENESFIEDLLNPFFEFAKEMDYLFEDKSKVESLEQEYKEKIQKACDEYEKTLENFRSKRKEREESTKDKIRVLIPNLSLEGIFPTEGEKSIHFGGELIYSDRTRVDGSDSEAFFQTEKNDKTFSLILNDSTEGVAKTYSVGFSNKNIREVGSVPAVWYDTIEGLDKVKEMKDPIHLYEETPEIYGGFAFGVRTHDRDFAEKIYLSLDKEKMEEISETEEYSSAEDNLKFDYIASEESSRTPPSRMNKRKKEAYEKNHKEYQESISDLRDLMIEELSL